MKTIAIPVRRASLLLCALIIVLLIPSGRSGPGAEPPADLHAAITQAPVFLYPLVWAGPQPPAFEESVALWDAIEVLRIEGLREGFAALESYVREHPRSPWTPSLRANLAEYYYDHARPTPALLHWAAAWDASRTLEDANGKYVAEFTLAHWSRALATHGQLAPLELLVTEAEGRRLEEGFLQQIFDGAKRRLAVLRKTPEAAYRCGSYALSQLAHALGLPPDQVIALMKTPAPTTGFSLGALAELSAAVGIPMVPVQRPSDDAGIAVPSIVRWQLSHYAAIVSERDGYFEVRDPTCSRVQWLTAETINAEASGYFLVLADSLPAGWRRLSLAEANSIVGGVVVVLFSDEEDEDCPKDEDAEQEETDANAPIAQHDPNLSDGCQECPPGAPGEGVPCEDECGDCPTCPDDKGMPVWRVSQPDINLWILDTPLYYTKSSGKRMAHRVAYRQRNLRHDTYDRCFNFGPGWEYSYLSFVEVDAADPNHPQFYAPLGGIRGYTADGVSVEFRSGSKMQQVTGGYQISYGTGSRNMYGYAFSYYSGITRYFQTQKVDRRGRTTWLNYAVANYSVHLTSIQDTDGQTTYLRYQDGRFPNAVTQIDGRYGRTASFAYNSQGRLARITDTLGLYTDFVYDGNGVPALMTNLYGPTTFSMTEMDLGEPDAVNRSVLVTEPLGRKSLFLFRGSSSFLPASCPAEEIPSVEPYEASFNLSGMDTRNSFQWAPQQYERLSAGFRQSEDPADLTVDDYLYGHRRHWLYRRQSGALGHALNMEQWPSPDGTTPGQKVWYDYESDPPTEQYQEGIRLAPLFVAARLSLNECRYTRIDRNAWGHPTEVTSTYSVGSAVSLRSTTYEYDASGKNLMAVRASWEGGPPEPQLRVAYSYDPGHPNCIQTVTRYAAEGAGYTTSYTYDAAHRPLTRQTAAGQTTTFGYTGGFLTQLTDSPVARTESYSYLNGDVRTHTDYLGLMRTFSWDNLDRLTRVDYPDTTAVVYGYTLLDRTSVTDRRNKTTHYEYNDLRQLTKKTSPRGHETTYIYCDCGSLETITDPLFKVTTFSYDAAGRRTDLALPDNVFIHYDYNPLGQLVRVTDSLGQWTATYNHQGLLATVNNAYGLYRSISYDVDDRPVAVTDAAGVTIQRTYDRLGRVLTRQIAGGLEETFEYSARGLIRHTDQLDKVTQYGYDEAQRKISETTPNNEMLQFTYDAAGNLLTLTDHRGKTTTWTYDTEGRMATKRYAGQAFANLEYTYNPNGQVATRRFFSGPGVSRLTSYTYDDAGNLTTVDYPAGTQDISIAYDALDRVSSMTDASGTTSYSYRDLGVLATENGPWANDTVTYTYNTAGLRSQLELQQPTGNWTQSYTYDAARRLDHLTAPALSANPFEYAYSGTGRRVGQVSFPTGVWVGREYDTLGRLTATYLKRQDGADLNRDAYPVYNDRHQITRHSRTDGSYVDFGYDNLGQLTSALGNGGQSTENLGYAYDGGWNMTQRTSGGTPVNYTINDRNQVINGPVGANGYDANGNRTWQTYDPNGPKTYSFTYDDENQLTSVATDSYYTPASGRWKSAFTYDGRGRLRKRTDYTWYTGGSGGWYYSGEVRYVYDGMLVIQERNSGNTPLVTYTRGLDLSATLQGAGGIGGLLARSHGYVSGTGAWNYHNFYQADAGGNITAMANNNTTNASLVAQYRYDPFGRIFYQSGSLASANVYRFSSKMVHANSGLYYYGFRFYDPLTQRWLNRDPIGEPGRWGWSFVPASALGNEANLYRYVRNCPCTHVDSFGLVDSWDREWVAGADIEECLDLADDRKRRRLPSTSLPYLLKLSPTHVALGGGAVGAGLFRRWKLMGGFGVAEVINLVHDIEGYRALMRKVDKQWAEDCVVCGIYWNKPEEAFEHIGENSPDFLYEVPKPKPEE